MPLAAAFRSLSRPSSPPRAKASPMRPCSFRYFFYALRHIFMYETKFDIVAFRFARETFCCVSTLVFSLSRLFNRLSLPALSLSYSDSKIRSVQTSYPYIFPTRQTCDSDAKGLQKGGVPAAPSGTATLLRLSPSHRFCSRARLAATHFKHPRLPWLDGRCVQGPGTYSPRHG